MVLSSGMWCCVGWCMCIEQDCLKCQYHYVVCQYIPASHLWNVGMHEPDYMVSYPSNFPNHCCDYPRSQHSGLLEKGTKNLTVCVCSVHIQAGISESKCKLWILLCVMIICELEVFCCDLHYSACYVNNVSDASAMGVLLQIYGITLISSFRNV
jgi:hypothetical protein